MKTEQTPTTDTVFLQTLVGAVSDLKSRLQRAYEQAYPGLGEIIRLILDEEENRAWALSPFPHLFLPDLVEAHIAKLNLQPAELRREKGRWPRDFTALPTYQPAFGLCG